MVLIHVDNLICVFYPSWMRQVQSKMIFVIKSLILLLISLILNCHFIWTSSVEPINGVCYSFSPNSLYRVLAISLTIVFRSLIPNLMLIVLSLIIIKKLKNLNKKRTNKQIVKKKNRTFDILLKRFIINFFVFIFVLLPINFLEIYFVIFPKIAFECMLSVYAFQMFSILLCLYYSLYFLVHVFIYKHEDLRKMSESYYTTSCRNSIKRRQRL